MTSTTYRVAELAATGISQSEIARRLGVSPQRVSHIAKRRGLPSRVENLKQRLRNERQGMSHTAAAERLGVSVSVIGKWNADLPKGFLVDGRAHGTGGRKSAVKAATRRIIEEAPALAAQGVSKSDAARRLDVSPPVLRAGAAGSPTRQVARREAGWTRGKEAEGGEEQG